MTMPAERTNMTSYWKQLDVAHHLNPQTNYRKVKLEEGGSRIITDARGVWLVDSDGGRTLDGMAGLWCVQLGYGREDLAEAARAQMLRLPYYNSFFKTTTPPTVELAAALSEKAPGRCRYAFFGSNGSDANDTFVRLARYYWSARGEPERVNFITRDLSYHGSSQITASLGGLKPLHKNFGIPLPHFHHVLPPYGFGFRLDGESDEEFGARAAQAVEDKILELGPGTVAAFLGEPVMGAGGVLIPPDNYWPLVQEICRKYDVLFGVDEVITGFGRLGTWFASERWGLEPDTVTTAKGISSGYAPLSALLVSERVARVLLEHGGDFLHGYTYSGHPVSCAVGLANIRALEEERVIETFAEEIAPHLWSRLQENFSDHPLVGEVRALGGLAAIELVAGRDPLRRFDPVGQVGLICRDHCVREGVISRAIRDSMVLCPPLVISREEVDEMVCRLRLAVDRTSGEVL